MKRVLAMLIWLAPVAAHAESERWECQPSGIGFNNAREPAIVLTINNDGETGTIMVAGTVHQASYIVQGFNRRWDFGLGSSQSDGFDYAFLIHPDGRGLYYEFRHNPPGETVEPR